MNCIVGLNKTLVCAHLPLKEGTLILTSPSVGNFVSEGILRNLVRMLCWQLAEVHLLLSRSKLNSPYNVCSWKLHSQKVCVVLVQIYRLPTQFGMLQPMIKMSKSTALSILICELDLLTYTLMDPEWGCETQHFVGRHR